MLPPSLMPAQGIPPDESQAQQKRTLRTASLKLILAQLESALRKTARSRREQTGRGKSRTRLDPGGLSENPKPGQAPWWLDVASPTWDDMRSLGKVVFLSVE